MQLVSTSIAKTATNKTAFVAADNSYRYFLTPKHGLRHSVLKIQVKARQMAAFRATKEGRLAERTADILQIGGGWYEVTSKDLTIWERAFGSVTDGTLIFVKGWNLFHVAGVAANPTPEVGVKYVRHVELPIVMGPQGRKAPVWTNPQTSVQRRDEERFQSKVQELAARFKPAYA